MPDAVDIPDIAVIQYRVGDRQTDHSRGIEALKVLPLGCITQKMLQWRLAMGDFLAPENQYRFRQATITQVILLNLCAFRTGNNRSIGYPVGAVVKLLVIAGDTHILNPEIQARIVKGAGAVTYGTAQGEA
ncbi:MAG: hypothetical protein PHO08_04820 [Methylococcales bacterium]|nr:hypothetical protein [Methylococcales bacterium]MDD5633516.1 hypothetical protein [Methylococcales bacterium]